VSERTIEAAPIAAFAELQLEGAGGEPVDLPRTLGSHGVATLPPNRVDEHDWTLETTLPVGNRSASTVQLSKAGPGRARLAMLGGAVSAATARRLTDTVRQMLRLDDDLSHFYELAVLDADLAWVTIGAGRMLRSPTVFEDVVKTICTTNCSWSATKRMVGALVEQLGDPAPDGRRAFPAAAAMAQASADFYRDVVRAGYRGAYLRKLADDVASGVVDLESLNDPSLPESEVAARLLALPGVGPYAAAHVMLTALGRYQRLILDSWTRPTYARLNGRKASDLTTERRFRRYGAYAGLAHWLRLTRDWIED
jgi:N-glycosylase/DNA lyase